MTKTSLRKSDLSLAEDQLRPMLDLVPVSDAAKLEICRRMSGSDRFYHGVGHLTLMWARHEHYAPAAGLNRPNIDRLVASAIAYHDAVYETDRRDNEERSADLWLERSEGTAASDSERQWVADTIRATRDHLGYEPEIWEADDRLPLEQRARFWLLDLDLAPIGEPPQVFDENTELLRSESQGIPPATFEDSRLRFLRYLNAAPRIYRSPVLASVFEAPARRNVERQLGF